MLIFACICAFILAVTLAFVINAHVQFEYSLHTSLDGTRQYYRRVHHYCIGHRVIYSRAIY